MTGKPTSPRVMKKESDISQGKEELLKKERIDHFQFKHVLDISNQVGLRFAGADHKTDKS